MKLDPTKDFIPMSESMKLDPMKYFIPMSESSPPPGAAYTTITTGYKLTDITDYSGDPGGSYTYPVPGDINMIVKSDGPLTQDQVNEVIDKAEAAYGKPLNAEFKKNWADPANMEGDNTVERTLVMLKPDAFERNLVGEIIDIISQKGMKLIAAKQIVLTPAQIKKHYQHHVHKHFFPDLVGFMTSGPCMALVFEGDSACLAVRQLIGNKHPSDSPPGSIRGRYATDFPRNLIHGSDNPSEANYEISLYFSTEELLTDERVREHAEKMQVEADKAIKELQEQKKAALAQPLKPKSFYTYPEQIKKGHIVCYGGYFGRVDSISISPVYQRLHVVVTLAHNGMQKKWQFSLEGFEEQKKLIFVAEKTTYPFGAGTSNPVGLPSDHPFWKEKDDIFGSSNIDALHALAAKEQKYPEWTIGDSK